MKKASHTTYKQFQQRDVSVKSPMWPAPGDFSKTNQAVYLCRFLFHIVKKKTKTSFALEKILEKELMYSGVQ